MINVIIKEDKKFLDSSKDMKTHSIKPKYANSSTSLTKYFDQESYLTSRRPSEGFVLSIDPPPSPYKIQICNKSEQKKMGKETETIIPESLFIHRLEMI